MRTEARAVTLRGAAASPLHRDAIAGVLSGHDRAVTDRRGLERGFGSSKLTEGVARLLLHRAFVLRLRGAMHPSKARRSSTLGRPMIGRATARWSSLDALRRVSAQAIVGGLFALAGCSVEALDVGGESATRNECSEHRECGGGRCVSGQCRAEQGEIEALLFEITPPADAPEVAGVRFVESVTGIDPRGGELTVELQHVSSVTGTITPTPEPFPCPAEINEAGASPSADGSLPARVTLRPRQRQLGLAVPSYTSDADFAEGSYRFSATVPPGTYDIYVEPRDVVGECTAPPQLFRDIVVDASDMGIGLKLNTPEQLDVVVRWPHPETVLDGWTLDVVEGESGRLLSTRGVLADPVEGAEGVDYQVRVAYVPVQPAGSGSELVRLSPPEGLAAPQVIIDRSVVELFEEGVGTIDQFRSLPGPVQVMGQVSAENSTTVVRATVSLVATELRMISPGTIAAFERVVETDESGQFSVDLLPGTYRVVALPPVGSGLSPTEAVWQISANQDVQAGRVVELAWNSKIHARVLGPASGVIAGAAVQAIAASGSTSQVGVLDRVLGRTSYTPRADGAVTDADGRFTMVADRGLFDLGVRPGQGTGFSWLVLPGVDASGPEAALGDVRLPLPVAYKGYVSSAVAAGASSALLRAYAYLNGTVLTNDPAEATAVLQVAESRVDADGAFQLLIPAHLGVR